MRTSHLLAVSALLALSVAVPAAAQDATVDVVDSAFEPDEVSVAVGDTVTWSQSGSLPHSVTADDGAFDSHPDCGSGGECLGNGDSYDVTFDTPGTYAYYCRIHGAPGGTGMSGTITVSEDMTAPPTEPTPTETAPAVTGSMTVSDQEGDGTEVVVDEASIEGADGWMVIHSDQDGAPGPVLGHIAMPEGTATDLAVPLDEPMTESATVWPMLHFDAGELGTYEFPGADGPVAVDGEVVMAPLAYTLTVAATDEPTDEPTAEPTDGEDDGLPVTGQPTGLLLLVALALVALGVGAVALRRRNT